MMKNIPSLLRSMSMSIPRTFTRNFSSSKYCLGQMKEIQVNIQDGIRKIEIDRPQKKNCLSLDMYQGLSDAINESNGDSSTNLVVITGTGDSFCAGNELINFLAPDKAEPSIVSLDRLKYIRECIEGFMMSLIDCHKPIIALVNGHAIGIGATMLPFCDVVLASDKAIFSAPFSSLGIVTECCSSYTFPKIMGYAKAKEFLVFSQKWDAKTAYNNHLLTTVYPHEEFAKKSWEKVEEISKLPINSLIYSKELMMGGVEREKLHQVCKDEWVRLEERFRSQDCFEAIRDAISKKSKK